MDLATYCAELLPQLLEQELSKREIHQRKIALSKKYKMHRIPTDIEILLHATNDERKRLTSLQTKPVRIGSGVAPLALMAKPYPCPHGRCTYCPGGIGSPFGDVPQSYTGHEPNPRRAARNHYDAFFQVFNRLEQYILNGYMPDKVDVILMGGTFLAYPDDYQEAFVSDIYRALNVFSTFFFDSGELHILRFKDFFELPCEINDKERVDRIHKKLSALRMKAEGTSLADEQLANETATLRCIGFTIETKPDWGFLEQGNRMLRFGVTKVELGVQTLDESVLAATHRGHTLADTQASIQILRDLGFKLNFHMMPGQPGSIPENDLADIKELFSNHVYQPDMLKLYPCMVIDGTALYKQYQSKKFTPLTTKQAADIIAEAKKFVPPYCRIMRVQRDIPTNVTIAGVDRTNLRQYVDERCKELGIICQCIRCRELHSLTRPIAIEELDFRIDYYKAGNGDEYFISANTTDDKLVGFARLRIPSRSLRKEITPTSALIRELHVYGPAVPLGKKGNIQHRGVGRELMRRAEALAREHKRDKIIVISGVGVRQYFAALGYSHEGPYMVKVL